jgi:Family of unknown function (DUF5677)
MNFLEKDIAAIKAINDHSKKTDIQYIDDVRKNMNLLSELMNSLHEEKIQMAEWLSWSEPIIVKLIFHSNTVLQIFLGIELIVQEKSIKIFDEPSAIILFRSILENYLTFHYLFIANIDEREKIFRINVWKYSALKQRSNFILNSKIAKEKQGKESVQVEELKDIICKSDIFLKFKTKEQKQILKGIKPRLFLSWEKLIEESGFRKTLFRNLYGFKSNYSHSEFISVLQIKSQGYGFNPYNKEHYILLLLQIIICKSIVDLKNLFPTICSNYEAKGKEVMREVEFFYQFGVDSRLDLIDGTTI